MNTSINRKNLEFLNIPNSESKEEKPTIDLAGLESLCVCQVCCMNFNESSKVARSLHCGHTFCTVCIETVRKYGNSAYLECPTCRAETKCPTDQMAINYFLMEVIRKLGFMGPSDDSDKKPAEKPAPMPENREMTMDETVDFAYRALITLLKNGIMVKFEEARAKLRLSTIPFAQNELTYLGNVIVDHFRFAYELLDAENDPSSELYNPPDRLGRRSMGVPRGQGSVRQGFARQAVQVVERQPPPAPVSARQRMLGVLRRRFGQVEPSPPPPPVSASQRMFEVARGPPVRGYQSQPPLPPPSVRQRMAGMPLGAALPAIERPSPYIRQMILDSIEWGDSDSSIISHSTDCSTCTSSSDSSDSSDSD